jgi:site-specific DNA-methyltransferase (adenine-specific)
MDAVFPGVDFEGGLLLLWDRDHEGRCEITTVSGEETVGRFSRLNEYDILARQPWPEYPQESARSG